MSKRYYLGVLSAGLLAVSLGITGSLAFRTTTNSKENVFLIGDDFGTGDTSKITLTEPSWKDSSANGVIASQSIKKDPTVTNNSDIPVYAFLVVEEPLITLNSQSTTLFNYTLNDGWVKLSSYQIPDMKTTVYAYAKDSAMTVLAPTESATLFNKIVAASSFGTETQVAGTEQTFTVRAYVIQSQGLKSTNPYDVWDIVEEQGETA
jgi:hypothetical protein